MQHFCTYFDSNYLPRGLALYFSFRQHVPGAMLHILCLDELCYQTLDGMNLASVRLIPLATLEQSDTELAQTCENRSRIEYYFTCTPCLPLYILEHDPSIDMITYIDADMFFYSDPTPVFDSTGDASVVLTAHNYAPTNSGFLAYGYHNVGWLSFRRTEQGMACLRWWRERCLEWCYDYVDGERFADQKYLDSMPAMFEGVVTLMHNGVNAAPWNIGNYRVSLQNNMVYLGNDPLVIYHFHGFKQKNSWLFDSNLAKFSTGLPRIAHERIYVAYLKTILPLIEQFPLRTSVRETASKLTLSEKLLRAQRLVHYSVGLLRGHYILTCN